MEWPSPYRLLLGWPGAHELRQLIMIGTPDGVQWLLGCFVRAAANVWKHRNAITEHAESQLSTTQRDNLHSHIHPPSQRFRPSHTTTSQPDRSQPDWEDVPLD